MASVGGFVKTYSVIVDPRRLQAHGIPLSPVVEAIRQSNRDVGGRGRNGGDGVRRARPRLPARHRRPRADRPQKGQADAGAARDVARVELAPDERRGLTELNGEGEVVSGIVAAALRPERARRHRRTSRRRSPRSAPSLPEDVRIETVYDRSDLIKRAIETLAHADRGEHHRRRRLRRLPAARPLGAGRHHHAAGGRADGVHRHARAWASAPTS